MNRNVIKINYDYIQLTVPYTEEYLNKIKIGK